MKITLKEKMNSLLLAATVVLGTAFSFSSVSSAITLDFLERKPHWACQTVKAFDHDINLDQHPNLRLSTYGAMVMNSGTFEVRTMFNTPKDLRGSVRLASLGDIRLFSVFNKVGDNGLQGEIQIETWALSWIQPADLRAKLSKAQASVIEPTRSVLFNVYCTSED